MSDDTWGTAVRQTLSGGPLILAGPCIVTLMSILGAFPYLCIATASLATSMDLSCGFCCVEEKFVTYSPATWRNASTTPENCPSSRLSCILLGFVIPDERLTLGSVLHQGIDDSGRLIWIC